MSMSTFIIDCPLCKAKVAAERTGLAENGGFDDEVSEPYGNRLYVGKCPRCSTLLAGESHQVDFEGYDAQEDRWSDIVRIYPKPAKAFSSWRIPRVVTDSLIEADKSLQVGAHTASCVMLGRALEAVCRDTLHPGSYEPPGTTPIPKTKIMLGEGIRKLKEGKFIDERLFDWSQQLYAFRNIAAHPEDIQISRQDAEDLQAFVYAIVEYIYDLTDRYDEFKVRLAKQPKKK
jgi:hypothetical protein